VWAKKAFIEFLKLTRSMIQRLDTARLVDFFEGVGRERPGIPLKNLLTVLCYEYCAEKNCNFFYLVC
jgi:hypothetical protein